MAIARRCAAALLIGALAGACSTPEGASTAPSVATGPSATEDPTRTVEASPSVEATPIELPTAGAFPEELVAGLLTETDVVVTHPLPCGTRQCVVPLDVLAPADAEGLPTVVLVHGGPASFVDRRYMNPLAAAIAQRGAVVFLATYRGGMTGNAVEDSLHDVRCAIRYARASTADFGGDPDRLVLVGHSIGSVLSIQIGVDREIDTPGCLADASGVPDAVVGLAGFGVLLADAAGPGPPFLLVSGDLDSAAVSGPGTAERLLEAGFEAEYIELEGIDHIEIVEPDADPRALDLIFEVAEATVP